MEKETENNSLHEWDTSSFECENEKNRIRTATFEFVTLHECGQIEYDRKTSQGTQTDKSPPQPTIGDMLKLYEKLVSDIKDMRHEIKMLTELASTMRKEMKEEIKDIKTLGEREKNRYVRSNIPFRFVPDHTNLGYQFGM